MNVPGWWSEMRTAVVRQHQSEGPESASTPRLTGWRQLPHRAGPVRGPINARLPGGAPCRSLQDRYFNRAVIDYSTTSFNRHTIWFALQYLMALGLYLELGLLVHRLGKRFNVWGLVASSDEVADCNQLNIYFSPTTAYASCTSYSVIMTGLKKVITWWDCI